MIKKQTPICPILGCCLLLISVYATEAFGQQWKYVPVTLVKPKKIPAVINPTLKPGVQMRLAKLDIQFEVNLARAKEQLAARQALAHVQARELASHQPQFSNFTHWLDQLEARKLFVDHTTRNAVQTLRQTLEIYPTLSAQQKTQVQQLIATLNQFHTLPLGKLENGDFYKIIYHPSTTQEALPQASGFHLKLEKLGLSTQAPYVQEALQLPIRSFVFSKDIDNPNHIVGIVFLQGFQPGKTGQEFEQVLALLTPPGYTVRLNAHEVGLSNTRKRFRQGFLHLHFEKIDKQPFQIPVDISIKLWLSVSPYAGVINPQTRKIIVPFNDKTIAKNYFTLFQKYLTPRIKTILQYISWGK